MNILLNNTITQLPSDFMTVDDLIKWKDINPVATAVAVNEQIVRKENWKTTRLCDLDRVSVISAAFGG